MSWISDLGHVVVVAVVKHVAGNDAAHAAGKGMEALGSLVTGKPMPRSAQIGRAEIE